MNPPRLTGFGLQDGMFTIQLDHLIANISVEWIEIKDLTY